MSKPGTSYCPECEVHACRDCDELCLCPADDGECTHCSDKGGTMSEAEDWEDTQYATKIREAATLLNELTERAVRKGMDVMTNTRVTVTMVGSKSSDGMMSVARVAVSISRGGVML